jgi:hypothetical protein
MACRRPGVRVPLTPPRGQCRADEAPAPQAGSGGFDSLCLHHAAVMELVDMRASEARALSAWGFDSPRLYQPADVTATGRPPGLKSPGMRVRVPPSAPPSSVQVCTLVESVRKVICIVHFADESRSRRRADAGLVARPTGFESPRELHVPVAKRQTRMVEGHVGGDPLGGSTPLRCTGGRTDEA